MNALLGGRIKALRTAKNYTQEQVADRLGISRQKYARVENGTNSITLDILAKIAEILDKYDVVRKYEFSRYDRQENNYGNHDAGYFGWGDKTTADGEEDAQDRKVDIYVEFESGKRLNIETSKASEIDAMKPILDELTEYLDSLF